jgi:hypothetical protein
MNKIFLFFVDNMDEISRFFTKSGKLIIKMTAKNLKNDAQFFCYP